MATNEQLEEWAESMEWMRKNKAQLDGAGLYLLDLYEKEVAKLEEEETGTSDYVPNSLPSQKENLKLDIYGHQAKVSWDGKRFIGRIDELHVTSAAKGIRELEGDLKDVTARMLELALAPKKRGSRVARRKGAILA